MYKCLMGNHDVFEFIFSFSCPTYPHAFDKIWYQPKARISQSFKFGHKICGDSAVVGT